MGGKGNYPKKKKKGASFGPLVAVCEEDIFEPKKKSSKQQVSVVHPLGER
jgi:hypothetical protein